VTSDEGDRSGLILASGISAADLISHNDISLICRSVMGSSRFKVSHAVPMAVRK